MHAAEQLLLVVGLSMDGFGASVCMGMAAGRRIWPIVGLISGFHVVMLLAGYVLGAGLPESFEHIFPWIAALLLTGMGIHMIREAAGPEAAESARGTLASTAALALATSLDAMTVGVAFALMEVPALRAASMTAAVMGSLSLTGAALGSRVGRRHRRAARTAGGAILCLLGLKLLIGAVGSVV